jgi:hypothetical protein
MLALLAMVMTGCRRTGIVNADTAASEICLQQLLEGFESVPDSIPDGRRTYLASRGVPVADILFYRGDGADATAELPAVPTGFNAAFIGTDALLDSLKVAHGILYDGSGANYRVLVLLDGCLSFPVLNKISDLAGGGAVIAGVRPTALSGPGDAAAFQDTVDRLWRSGNVISGVTLRSVLSAAGVRPDLKSRRPVVFRHRHLPEADIYCIANPDSLPLKGRLKFRVIGRRPALWDPATGGIRPLSYKIRKWKTKVDLPLDAGEEAFVVFGPVADRRKLRIRPAETENKH